MNYIKALMASLALILVLAACGGNEPSSTESPTTDNQATEDDQGTTDLSVDEVIQKSIEAMNKLESYTMEMNNDQELQVPGEDPFSMTMTMVADITMEPLRLYQKMTMQGLEENVEVLETESYFTEEGMFVQDTMVGGWVKFPEEFSQEILQASQQQMNAEEQLKLFKQFAEETELTEDETHYILSVKGTDDNFKTMAQEAMGFIEEAGVMMDELLGMMNVETFNYIIYIDKGTFYQTKMDMEMHMSMTIEDETMTSIQRMTGVMTNFNGVGEITIPQEVIDTADEFNFDYLEGLEDMEDFDFEDFDFEDLEEELEEEE
ncbi:DUF6612 family protein [Alkalihalobacterium elongatum]|uniref:DUF6612 family protein n=1 Tax=Alkalihalobacterium elongatum TaxID=2675466 RepID=UPI001C1F9B19|nr:DUF6612 family protein [Alkalihalobacterium elongatum]